MDSEILKMLQALKKPELLDAQKEALKTFQGKTLEELVDWLKKATYQDGEKTMRFIPTDVDPELDVLDLGGPLPTSLSTRLDGFIAALSSISNSDRKERSIAWAQKSLASICYAIQAAEGLENARDKSDAMFSIAYALRVQIKFIDCREGSLQRLEKVANTLLSSNSREETQARVKENLLSVAAYKYMEDHREGFPYRGSEVHYTEMLLNAVRENYGLEKTLDTIYSSETILNRIFNDSHRISRAGWEKYCQDYFNTHMMGSLVDEMLDDARIMQEKGSAKTLQMLDDETDALDSKVLYFKHIDREHLEVYWKDSGGERESIHVTYKDWGVEGPVTDKMLKNPIALQKLINLQTENLLSGENILDLYSTPSVDQHMQDLYQKAVPSLGAIIGKNGVASALLTYCTSTGEGKHTPIWGGWATRRAGKVKELLGTAELQKVFLLQQVEGENAEYDAGQLSALEDLEFLQKVHEAPSYEQFCSIGMEGGDPKTEAEKAQKEEENLNRLFSIVGKYQIEDWWFSQMVSLKRDLGWFLFVSKERVLHPRYYEILEVLKGQEKALEERFIQQSKANMYAFLDKYRRIGSETGELVFTVLAREGIHLVDFYPHDINALIESGVCEYLEKYATKEVLISTMLSGIWSSLVEAVEPNSGIDSSQLYLRVYLRIAKFSLTEAIKQKIEDALRATKSEALKQISLRLLLDAVCENPDARFEDRDVARIAFAACPSDEIKARVDDPSFKKAMSKNINILKLFMRLEDEKVKKRAVNNVLEEVHKGVEKYDASLVARYRDMIKRGFDLLELFEQAPDKMISGTLVVSAALKAENAEMALKMINKGYLLKESFQDTSQENVLEIFRCLVEGIADKLHWFRREDWLAIQRGMDDQTTRSWMRRVRRQLLRALHSHGVVPNCDPSEVLPLQQKVAEYLDDLLKGGAYQRGLLYLQPVVL